MIDAIVLSHCCILNSDERLELVRLSNKFAEIMGDIEVDRLKLKEASKKKKDGENIAKAAWKKLNEEKKRNKDKLSREICKATMKDLSEKEEAHTSKLTVPVLKGLIQFVF